MAVGGNARAKIADYSDPPWFRWREKDPAERCIRFIETYCRSPKGVGHGKPIKLAEFQKRWIRDILRDGIRQAILMAPRGQGKSTLLAAIALWALFDKNPTGQPIVPIVATTVRQAIRSVYDVAVKMVLAEPQLSNRANCYTADSSARIVVGYSGGECFPIANDISNLQGLDFSACIIDEIGFQNLTVWNALVMASGKRTQSLIVGIGTPGIDRDTSALWNLRQAFLEGKGSTGFSFTELSAPDGCDIHDERMWRLANPAIDEGYLSIDALRNDAALMPESEFRLYRLAQFVEGVDCWLGTDGRRVWRDLKSDYQLVDGADTWVGVDIGLKRDSTACVVGQYTPEGVFHTTAKIWNPRTDGAIDVSAIMQHLRQLDEKYHLMQVVFDPRHFELHAQTLADEGLPMMECPQRPERMIPACGDLFEQIMRKEISHNGAADYERQILNAMPAYSDNGGFRLTKSGSRGHIDAAIALALCHHFAVRPEKPLPEFVALI